METFDNLSGVELLHKIKRMSTNELIDLSQKMDKDRNPMCQYVNREINERTETMSIDELTRYFNRIGRESPPAYLFSREIRNRIEKMFDSELKDYANKLQNENSLDLYRLAERELYNRGLIQPKRYESTSDLLGMISNEVKKWL